MKHGRSGRPKLRRLFCDESLSTLFWREVETPSRRSIEGAAGVGAAGVGAAGVGASSSGEEEQGKKLKPGENFPPEHEQSAAEEEVRGRRRRRSSFLRFHKDDSDRKVSVSDILEVTDDLSAEVIQRSISRQQLYSLGHNQDLATCVISLVLRNRARTYDFEIDEKSWNALFHSFRILVNYYQVDLPANNEPSNNQF
jgi:hypothetical protein